MKIMIKAQIKREEKPRIMEVELDPDNPLNFKPELLADMMSLKISVVKEASDGKEA